MNKATFVKRVQPLMTKKGEIHNSYYFELLDVLCGRTKFYYNTWHRNNRHYSLSDKSDRYIKLFKALKLKYYFGNDAPRSGKEGEFIALTDSSIRVAKELSKMYKSYEEERVKSNLPKI